MSNYTSTFTENTGDSIDTSDFSTEFDAIETASATKADKAAPATTNNLAMLNASGNLADSLVETDGSGNITANVTGALTGNADTATAWATGRTFSVSGDAAGSTGSVDGTGNVDIAVSLAANSVNSVEIVAEAVTSSEINTVEGSERNTNPAGAQTINLQDGEGWYICAVDSGTDYEYQVNINSSWLTIHTITTNGYAFFYQDGYTRLQKTGASTTVFRWRKLIG